MAEGRQARNRAYSFFYPGSTTLEMPDMCSSCCVLLTTKQGSYIHDNLWWKWNWRLRHKL